MLTHRTNIFLLSSLLLISAFLIRAYNLSFGILFLPLLIFLIIEIIGASRLSANFHFKSICSFQTTEKVVSITFDDGPHGGATEKVLSVLKEFNVTSTFFCIGNKINGDISLVKKMSDAGHIIANHSYTHGNLFNLQPTSLSLLF